MSASRIPLLFTPLDLAPSSGAIDMNDFWTSVSYSDLPSALLKLSLPDSLSLSDSFSKVDSADVANGSPDGSPKVYSGRSHASVNTSIGEHSIDVSATSHTQPDSVCSSTHGFFLLNFFLL